MEGYAAKSAPEIRAQRIILVDPSGRARGRLQVSSGGTPSLELNSQNSVDMVGGNAFG
ncbi:MAG: hypothetical protein RX316_09890 [bacterium]|nr:hypothetical protein [bacterium]